MNKWIVILAAGVALAAGIVGAVTQPQSIGLVTAIVESKTIAQMNLYAPKAAGQLLYCSNCLQSAVCVASGTAAGAWVVTSATSTDVLGGLIGHCR